MKTPNRYPSQPNNHHGDCQDASESGASPAKEPRATGSASGQRRSAPESRDTSGHPRRRRAQSPSEAQSHRGSSWSATRSFPAIDRIHLQGGLGDFDERLLKINRVALPPLSQRRFLVLLVLACHSLALSGVEKVPVKVDSAAFLTAKVIVRAIEEYLRGLRPRPGVFLDPDPMHVTDLIYEIRREFDDLRINRNLIENGPSRYGYRLGVPPQNVELTFVLPGGQGVIHLKGRRPR